MICVFSIFPFSMPSGVEQPVERKVTRWITCPPHSPQDICAAEEIRNTETAESRQSSHHNNPLLLSKCERCFQAFLVLQCNAPKYLCFTKEKSTARESNLPTGTLLGEPGTKFGPRQSDTKRSKFISLLQRAMEPQGLALM